MPMDIEQVFAAEVFNAASQATTLQQQGIGSSASDFIDMALCDLWQMAPSQAQAIAETYVFWDEQGRPWPRPAASGNVLSLR